MLTGSSKGFRYTSALNYRSRQEVIDDFDPFGLTPNVPHQAPSEIVLETKICEEWRLGRCVKGEKCRFPHKTRTQEQDSHILHKESATTSLSKEDPDEYPTKGDSRIDDESGEKGADDKDARRGLQNDAGLFFGVLMTLFVLEQVRQLVFNDGREGRNRGEEDIFDAQRRLKLFDGLGKTRREEVAIEERHEGDSNGLSIKGEETKRWVEDEELANRKNIVNTLLEARRLSEQILEENLEENTRNRDSGIQKSANFNSTISQYIVLESNLVTCGPGLEIHQITPGYDLCQISLQLPKETTGAEIVEMLLEEELDGSDFHILGIEESGEQLEAIILTNIKFGNALERRADAFGNRTISFEVRRDAIWTSGTMRPGNKASLMLTWDSDSSSFDEEDTSHMALAAVYDSLFELEGSQMDSCCLLTSDSELESTVTLTVRFDSWQNALGAARDIESKRPSGIPSFQAKVPNSHQQSVTIPFLQYEAQKRLWLELSQMDNEEARIEIEIIDDVVVHVQGENKVLVGAFKVRVEKLARGEVLEGAYWHPSFASLDESTSFFGEVMETGIYLQCRSDARSLVLYGESDHTEGARRMIRAEVNRREQVMTKTALRGSSIGFFRNGGAQKLQDLVGQDLDGNENASLESTSRWSAIKMKGGETATHHLRRLIKESLVEEPIACQDPTKATCPVCLQEQLYPEILECGHGYCLGCLAFFLDAAVDNQNFPIVCVGEGATCNVPIALPFIRRFLPHYTFKQLIEAAFAAYLEQNPTQFRYCKTPDCRQTYRWQSADQASIITCPSCFAEACSSCSEDHKNMSCTEYRILHDPEEQERLNNELADNNGYKKCPRCAVWVEKTGGCNHMTCRCGAHICWTCLELFEIGQIYEHMETH